MHTPSLLVLSGTAATVASLVAAVTDRRTGLIPNWLTLPTTIVGIALNAAFGGLSGGCVSLVGLLAGAVVPMILFAVSRGRAIGGGDVKLFAGLGALLGPSLSIEIEFGAFVLIAVFAMFRITLRGVLSRVLLNSVTLLINPLLPRKYRRPIDPQTLTEMRLGPAIACSVVSTLVLEHLSPLVPWIS